MTAPLIRIAGAVDAPALAALLLLRALLAHADEHDYVRVVLSPSQRSVPFYRRFGFGADGGLLVRHLTT